MSAVAPNNESLLASKHNAIEFVAISTSNSDIVLMISSTSNSVEILSSFFY